ncbi:hypothetical protein HSX37_16180|uniref:Uncharacterized protein n=1 Tax=Dendrosporobacter quercicolus TaxID=146817 RepID=A0A1G9ZQ08_9FIRM|nr:hypothetical protein [Dendrosporobacter quercicolus]NSL49574.1 hypothetical protein [Dendrosporobacter quercicolus DSM 1736]SDN23310.1 hypothetical protein SAMN04488502_11530 [Dendrosporobacter quercicolus]
MLWWPIAKHLVDFLAAKPEFAEPWQVYPGSKGKAKEYPCVEVQWDQESGLSVHKSNEGGITLWVDVWVPSDEVEPDVVYQQQYEVQRVILDSLRDWSDLLLKDLKVAAKVDCPGIASEGTITRPTFGCSIILTIEWRKSRYV